jgi:3',5'-cyclic AMP phosphodiesterase CpdA
MRIAHFSDLHVLALEGVGAHRFLNKRITGYANLRFKRKHNHHARHVRAVAREIARAKVDHVVVTGDLTNLALETEFEAVRKLIEEELAIDPAHVSVVPGNHDLYTYGALSSKRFTRYFAPYIVSDLPDLATDIGLGHFPFVRLRGPAAIIGLSSAVPQPPLVAAGKLGSKQLTALGRVLAHPEVKKRTPVVLLHHPAHNPLSKVKTLLEGLHDATLLWSTVKDVAEGLVLHGHLHRRIHQTLPTERGRLHAIGATSASLEHEDEARMAGFNLYEIDDASGVVSRVEAHVLDPKRDVFDKVSVPRYVAAGEKH